MAAAKIAFIPDILEEHYEELQFLWGVRQKMLRSPTQYLRDLLQFEERIEAHLQGLLLAADNLNTIVGGGLASEDQVPPASRTLSATVHRLLCWNRYSGCWSQRPRRQRSPPRRCWRSMM
jgi:hypothetical protein